MSKNLKCKKSLVSIRSAINNCASQAADVAMKIGQLAEPPLREFKSADLLCEFLANNGFEVSRPWEKLPTAFLAVSGDKGPTIMFMAEYDALPDCGPRSGLWGHGCGHNLLGTGSAVAGIAAAAALKKSKKPCRIVVIGTPAEETLGGKVFLGELGAFQQADAIMAWHPSTSTIVDLAGMTAMDSALYSFSGKTAHAAFAPHEGRSALDAAMLMDIGVNYLREHIPTNARIHCVVTNGGKAPNVVPDSASLWYYIRGANRKQVDELRERVNNCARGAAIATDTTWKMQVLTACSERIPNRTLAELAMTLVQQCGGPGFSAADTKAAQKVIPTCCYVEKPEPMSITTTSGSSDEDNASWFAPILKFWHVCIPKPAVLHHRHTAALAQTPAAHKGMLKASEIMAAAAVELVLNPALLKKAQAEFKQNRKGKKYELPLAKNAIELSQAMADGKQV